MSQKNDIMLFGKWNLKEIDVRDPGLRRYISLKPIYIPHTMGRHEHGRFRKSELNIVERLVNNLMRPGKSAGKKGRTINMIMNTLEIIHLRTGLNPVEIIVRAIENSAPREDTTRIRFGGVVYHLAVDISPQKRTDLALHFLSEGARRTAFNNSLPLEEALAEELISASNKDVKSYAIQKCNEIERVAMASR